MRLSVVAVAVFAPTVVAAPPVDFNRDVRPILSGSCYACHGPDAKARKAGLRLDDRAAALKKEAFQPGKADASELVRRLTAADPDERMPPSSSKKPALTKEQIDTLTRWVNEGAKYADHWAFAPIARPAVPTPSDAAWAKNPVDAFVRYRLDQEGLKPSPEADRVTLLRRLSFDLTGLPPTPEQVRAFVADQSPDAFEKQVERLLASPHFGERMAVWWLDLVRYADSIGYHSDNPMPVSPYRDYVIRSFNANTPFDRFTVEQLAGDLLPSATVEQRVASGYNRLLQTTEEGGAQPKEYEAKYAADRVRNYGQVWLGGTLMCAECHDHKFDPYRQREFYQIAAFFADVQEASVGRREPGMPVPSASQAAELTKREAAVAWAKKAYPAVAAVALPAARANVESAEKAKAEFESTVPRVLVTTSGPPRKVRVLHRGNWQDESGEVVSPGTPKFLPPLPEIKGRPTRLDLAKWTVSADNPLPARVTANRLWKLFFGAGLSRSLEESGSQGDPPTHPELLEFLASEFRSDWDVKELIRRIVTSKAYRQSSKETAALRERDPANRLLARQGRHRLDAEFIRDTALAVSGLLVADIGGGSVKPYQPAGYWAALNFPVREWQNDAGARLYRRGMYTHWQRSFPHPSLVAFDAPSREECTCDRPRSNIPQQALALLNDPTYVEAARVFAAGAVKAATDDAGRLRWAFERATGRTPTDAEAKVLLELLADHRAEFAKDAEGAKKALAVGAAPVPNDVPAGELAAWASVCRALLNLHETITRP